MQVVVRRLETGDQGTFGVLTAGAFVCRMIELPWRENRNSVSCIPPGEYGLFPRWSKWRGYLVYQLDGVPDRVAVQIHVGNVAGDKSLGWLSHSEGCLLVGREFGVLRPPGKRTQRGVLLSRPSMSGLMETLGRTGRHTILVQEA